MVANVVIARWIEVECLIVQSKINLFQLRKELTKSKQK